jgi:type IV pilus assembly protein PilN
MRLNINLATKPYEDVGKFLARWGMITVLLAILTAGLLFTAVSNYRNSKTLNAQIVDRQQKIDALEKDRANAIEILGRPANKSVATTSRFFNDALQRKSLSWTRIFMDLERIMPPGLHVVSITPEMNKDNQLGIRLLVGGSSHDKAVELVHRMEESPTFKRAQLHSEMMAQGTADAVQFEITSTYIPAHVTPQAPAKSESKVSQTMAKSGGAR